MEDEIRSIVFDCGNYSLKSGFGGDNFPSFDTRSVISNDKEEKKYVGENCFLNNYEKIFPYKREKINDYDALENLFHYTFYEKLKMAPEEFPILLSQNLFPLKSDKEKLYQIIFETFNNPACFVAIDLFQNVRKWSYDG